MPGNLTGAAAFVLTASALLTVPTAALLLWLYRRAVRRGMILASVAQGVSPDFDASPETTFSQPRPIAIHLLEYPSPDAGKPGHLRRVAHSLRRAVLLHALAGIPYAPTF